MEMNITVTILQNEILPSLSLQPFGTTLSGFCFSPEEPEVVLCVRYKRNRADSGTRPLWCPTERKITILLCALILSILSSHMCNVGTNLGLFDHRCSWVAAMQLLEDSDLCAHKGDGRDGCILPVK